MSLLVKVLLSPSDAARLMRLEKTRQLNFRVLRLYADYLNYDPRFVTPETLDMLIKDCGVTPEQAFCGALSALFGLDCDASADDRIISRKYLNGSVACLDPAPYRSQPYIRTVSFPESSSGDWELTHGSIAPCEGFIYNDITVMPDYTELPRLGFFRSEYTFPSVRQGGREWMTLAPNETATLASAVSGCFGRVITFGLGLGYFAFMASGKDCVSSVTVIEKDENAIKLFRECILPHFPHRDKITVICADAFEYARNDMPGAGYDYALADIWHDLSDGFSPYIRFRRLALLTPGTVWSFWLEGTMLSHLRWLIFDRLRESFESGESVFDGGEDITSFARISDILSDDNLRITASKIREEKGRIML